jgi:phage gp36-like protein
VPYATRMELERLALPPEAVAGISDDPLEVDAVVNQGLEAASATADGYLAARFDLPLTAWADDLTRVVCIIAAYDIMVVRGFNPDFVDENLRQRYDDSLRWLRDVAGGKVHPAVTDSTPDESEGGPIVESEPRRGW